ncbi:helix-turn-helix domain-containing protein, partial [Pseudoduganella sp. RAF53_2]
PAASAAASAQAVTAAPLAAVSSPADAAAPGISMPPLPAFDVLPSDLPAYLAAVERDIIIRALAQTSYNRTQAAQLLGISFRQLRYQMQKLNIQEPET